MIMTMTDDGDDDDDDDDNDDGCHGSTAVLAVASELEDTP